MPFLNLLSFLGAHDQTFFFDEIYSRFPESIQNGVVLAIRRIAPTLLMQICEAIAILDERIWEGHRVATIEGKVLVTALTLYPEFLEPVTAVCLQRRNPIVLIAILTKVPVFDGRIFARILTTTGREEIGAIWAILSFLIVEESEICGNLVTVFERIVRIGRLRLLVAATRIIPEADALAGELAPPPPQPRQFARPFVIETTLSVDKPMDKPFLMIVTDGEWSRNIVPRERDWRIQGRELFTSASSKKAVRCRVSEYESFSIGGSDPHEHIQIFGLGLIGMVILILYLIQMRL
jgi:hypothetical protein